MFNVVDGFKDLPVVMPCGTCAGCLLERSRQWAIRCMHEASLYEDNCFVTLTVDDEHLAVGASLVKRDLQLFWKRLRKAYPAVKFRYFACGEYGESFGRPHYHAAVFGFDFPDKYVWSVRKGFTVWRSEGLERLWGNGLCELGSVTFESAAYVARYVMKKEFGANAWMHYQRVDLESGETRDISPEFTCMSRRPGIGRPWLEKFMSDVYPEDGVVVRGRLMKPPRYYDGQYEVIDGPGAHDIKRLRKRARRLEDETPERLAVREECTKARLSRLERSI